MKVYKLYSIGCPICEDNKKFDKKTCLHMGFRYDWISIEAIANTGGDWYNFISENLVDEEGSVTVPVYVIMKGDLVVDVSEGGMITTVEQLEDFLAPHSPLKE